MKPSAMARRKKTKGRRFVAIDFETANHSRDSACSVGIAIAEGGRIVALERRLIRPPTREFFFTDIHGLTWNEVRNEPSFADLITTQAKRNLSSRSGIGGVLSAT